MFKCSSVLTVFSHYSHWYYHSFYFRDEDIDQGFVIESEDIGLRLKAFEYWKCAETGLSSGNRPDSIKFVVAEALPNQGTYM